MITRPSWDIQLSEWIVDDRLDSKRGVILWDMNHNTSTALVAIAALAAVMIAGTIAVGNGNMAFAKSGSRGKMSSGDKCKDKGNGNGNVNDGISVPTDTQQKQECQTAGGASPITASCTAASTNVICSWAVFWANYRSNTKIMIAHNPFTFLPFEDQCTSEVLLTVTFKLNNHNLTNTVLPNW